MSAETRESDRLFAQAIDAIAEHSPHSLLAIARESAAAMRPEREAAAKMADVVEVHCAGCVSVSVSCGTSPPCDSCDIRHVLAEYKETCK